MSHQHDHSTDTGHENRLGWSIFLNTLFTIIEFIAGFFSGSLALISDATHNLTDTVSLFVAYTGNKVSQKDADSERTYGYGRASIIAALINGIILLTLSIFILNEAYQRILHPEPVQGSIVAIVAGIGILINGGVALMLFQKSKNDVNTFSAFVNMALDAVSSVGALIGGILIVVTGKTFIDPLISVLIAFMLLYGAYSVLKSVLHILLESVPVGVNAAQVLDAIKKQTDVVSVDDLHIWAISSQYAALSCHVVVDEESLQDGIQVVQKIKAMLVRDFQIQHATIEIEIRECEDTEHL